MDKIHCGWLTKSPPETRAHGLGRIFRSQWRRRYFVLYAPPVEMITLTRQDQCQAQLDYYDNDRCTKKKGTINLAHCDEVLTSLDSAFYKHMFALHTVDARGLQRTYHLAADTETEMEKWAEVLCAQLGMYDNRDFLSRAAERTLSVTSAPPGCTGSVTSPPHQGGPPSSTPRPAYSQSVRTPGPRGSPLVSPRPHNPYITPEFSPSNPSPLPVFEGREPPALPCKSPREHNDDYINLAECVSESSPPPVCPPRRTKSHSNNNNNNTDNERYAHTYNERERGGVTRMNSGRSSESSGCESGQGLAVTDSNYDTPQSFLSNHNIRVSSDDCFSEEDRLSGPSLTPVNHSSNPSHRSVNQSSSPAPYRSIRSPPPVNHSSGHTHSSRASVDGVFEDTYDRLPTTPGRGKLPPQPPSEVYEYPGQGRIPLDPPSETYEYPPSSFTSDSLYDIPPTMSQYTDGGACIPPPQPHAKVHRYINAPCGSVVSNSPSLPPKHSSRAGPDSVSRRAGLLSEGGANSNGGGVAEHEDLVVAQVSNRTRSFKRPLTAERPVDELIPLPMRRDAVTDDSSSDDEDEDNNHYDVAGPMRDLSVMSSVPPPASSAPPTRAIQYVDLDIVPSTSPSSVIGSASTQATPTRAVIGSASTQAPPTSVQYTEIDSMRTDALNKVRTTVEQSYSRSSTPLL